MCTLFGELANWYDYFLRLLGFLRDNPQIQLQMNLNELGEQKLISLTLSQVRSLLYRNQSINLRCKSTDLFRYDKNLRHENCKGSLETIPNLFGKAYFWILNEFSKHCNQFCYNQGTIIRTGTLCKEISFKKSTEFSIALKYSATRCTQKTEIFLVTRSPTC